MREKTDEEIRLQQRSEDFAEEKKKKESFNFFAAAYADKVKARLEEIQTAKDLKALDAFFASLEKKEKVDLPALYEKSKMLTDAADAFLNDLNEFFDLSEDTPANKNMKNLMKKADMDEKLVVPLMLSFAGKNMKAFIKGIRSRHKLDAAAKKGLENLKSECADKVLDALNDYINNDPKKIAKSIADGLKNCCSSFASAKDDTGAMMWASLASRFIYALESKPNLLKYSGLNENQMKIARETVMYADNMHMGRQLFEAMAEMKLNNMEIGKDQSDKMLDSIMRMQYSSSERQNLFKKWDEPVLVKGAQTPVLQ